MTKQPTENAQEEEITSTGPNWGRIAVWVGLFALLLVTGLGLIRSQEGSVSAGEPAPEFELTTFDGQIYSSEDMKGKVVVLNFWASFDHIFKYASTYSLTIPYFFFAVLIGITIVARFTYIS